jgi:hypothetical protein
MTVYVAGAQPLVLLVVLVGRSFATVCQVSVVPAPESVVVT